MQEICDHGGAKGENSKIEQAQGEGRQEDWTSHILSPGRSSPLYKVNCTFNDTLLVRRGMFARILDSSVSIICRD